MQQIFGAIDIGASSGRLIAGRFDAGKISLQEVHRFPNGALDAEGLLVWDFRKLMEEIRVGLGKLAEFAQEIGGTIASIGVDTWAVDYGLLRGDELLAQPNCYRDPLNQIGVDGVHKKVSFADMYSIAGLQFLPFNTVYQLTRQVQLQPELIQSATDILMIPDLIGFFLTGKKATERTNASSTGMLDAKTRTWSQELIEGVGLTEVVAKFPMLASAGDSLGKVLPAFGPSYRDCSVVLVGSHDTASAVVGVPATDENFAFISSGTWSLLGSELLAPILSEESRDANFTNELGVSDRIRYLKNLSGLWLLAECLRDWNVDSAPHTLAKLLAAASTVNCTSRLDLSDSNLIAPGNMPDKINLQLEQNQQPIMSTQADFVALILHSLALSYSDNLVLLEELTGQTFDSIHVVGGGSQNAVLSQLTANYSQKPVHSGPVEATAIGNLVVQMQSAGLIPMELRAARSVIANSDFQLTTYQPKGQQNG